MLVMIYAKGQSIKADVYIAALYQTSPFLNVTDGINGY